MSLAESEQRGDTRGSRVLRETFRLSVLATLAACQPALPSRQSSPIAASSAEPQPERLAPAPRRIRPQKLSVGVRLDAETPLGPDGAPRDALWLALRFELPPGTHVYWSNPGESGLATTAQFTASPGVELSRVHYPGPTRFHSERGATSYGYQDELALLVHVTGLTLNDAARVYHFTAEAHWLACSEVCVAEHAIVSLALNATHREQAASHPIAWWLDQRILEADSIALQVTWPTPQVVSIQAEPDIKLEEFFPNTPLAPDESDPPVTHPQPNQLTIIHPTRPVTQPLSGVVRTKTGDRTRFHAVKLR